MDIVALVSEYTLFLCANSNAWSALKNELANAVFDRFPHRIISTGDVLCEAVSVFDDAAFSLYTYQPHSFTVFRTHAKLLFINDGTPLAAFVVSYSMYAYKCK